MRPIMGSGLKLVEGVYRGIVRWERMACLVGACDNQSCQSGVERLQELLEDLPVSVQKAWKSIYRLKENVIGWSRIFSVVQSGWGSSERNWGKRWHERTSVLAGMMATWRKLLRVDCEVGGRPVMGSGVRKARNQCTYNRGS